MPDTLAAPHGYEEVIKKSRFVAHACAAESVSAAMEFVAGVADAEATHSCWAYRIGAAYRFSDDGEPGGTAGRPILQAIDGQNLDRVVVVVTRYFGGIKLGAGGLVRAYGGVASSCLRTASRVPIVPRSRWRLDVPFDASGTVHHWMDREGVSKLAERYGPEGVTIEIELADEGAEQRLGMLVNAARGRVKWERAS